MNVDWLFHLPAPARRLLYFSLQRAIGSRVGAAYKEFLQWTGCSRQQLNLRVEKRLNSLLQHAVQHIPYYRQLNIPQSSSGKDWLRNFPVLERSEVRSSFSSLVSDSLQGQIPNPSAKSAKRYDWLVVKTGGTTGQPTSVVHDAFMRDSGRATRLFSQRLCGFPLGIRYFKLWGSEQDLLQQKENLDRRILRNLLGEIPMNSFRSRSPELRQHLQTIKSHPEIQHMMAYVDSAGALANFAKTEGSKISLKTLMACAGNVTPALRADIQSAFGGQVFDKYGSRECNDIACECSFHQGLHIYSPAVFVEVVDDQGTPVAQGKCGRILITLLNSHSFPMIRYEIGDVGILAPPGDCACGLPFPKIERIEGRMDDMLTTNDGNLLTSVFVRHMVGVALNKQNVSEWQLEQTAPDKILFHYVPLRKDGIESTLNELQDAFRRALGPDISIMFSQVSCIPPSPTGKHRWIVNHCKGQRSNPTPA